MSGPQLRLRTALRGAACCCSFLYIGTRSLFEQAGFTYDRPKGTKTCAMSNQVAPLGGPDREPSTDMGEFPSVHKEDPTVLSGVLVSVVASSSGAWQSTRLSSRGIRSWPPRWRSATG
jgi:hypothetical protein